MKQVDKISPQPCDVIFRYVEKPEQYLNCKSIHLYDNRWRVNVYSKRVVDGIDSQYISHSYFIHFNQNTAAVDFRAGGEHPARDGEVQPLPPKI